MTPDPSRPRIAFIEGSQEPGRPARHLWSIQVHPEDEASYRTVCMWMEALEFHLEKARDYQGAEQELGPKAQFVDMSRKWVKVKNAMWFGKELTGSEKLPEIIMDLMAHCALTLKMFKWPGNKPWSKEVDGPNYVWPDTPTPGS